LEPIEKEQMAKQFGELAGFEQADGGRMRHRATTMHETTSCRRQSGERSQAGPGFQSTLWSQVRAAGRNEAAESTEALEALCRNYWQPIYAFLRRCGHEAQTAEDLTQGFFLYVLQEDLLKKADQERGRFRSFLLGSLKFFVSNEQARARSLKRGGRATFIPIDAEASRTIPLLTQLTPERVFERKWALAVLARAMARLQAEYGRAGAEQEFAALQPYITGEPEDHLSDLALRLGKAQSATRVMMFRIRNRFRRLIREVIADTLLDPSQVEAELEELQRALREQ
jgi:DNA-directed RNA polymerase specialized sigma24 family protein